MFLKLSFALLNLAIFAQINDDRQIKIHNALENEPILFRELIPNINDYFIYPYNKVVISNLEKSNHTILNYVNTNIDEDWAEMIFYNKLSGLRFRINILCEPNTNPYRINSFNGISKIQKHGSITLMMDSVCKSQTYSQDDIVRFHQYVYAILIIVLFQIAVLLW
jgi:hypothetical protein